MTEDNPPEYMSLMIFNDSFFNESLITASSDKSTERPPEYTPPPGYFDAFEFPLISTDKNLTKRPHNFQLLEMLDQLSHLESIINQLG